MEFHGRYRLLEVETMMLSLALLDLYAASVIELYGRYHLLEVKRRMFSLALLDLYATSVIDCVSIGGCPIVVHDTPG